MPVNEDKKIDFLFTIFTETNEHIRATDEKRVLITGSYIALIAVIIVVLLDKTNTNSLTYFIFSLFILLIGSCVYILQLWYRAWKEHYLEICYNIASNFKLEENFLPFWLREHRGVRKFSADKVLSLITGLINFGVISFSLYSLGNLIDYPRISQICFLSLYISLIVVVKRKLIGKQQFLTA